METLFHLLDRAAAEFPGSVALQGDVGSRGWVALTRPEVRDRAAALAQELIGAGVKPGEAVALLSPNRPEWAVGYFAVVLAGGVLVPLDVSLGEGELSNILERSKAAALVTDDSQRERAALFRGHFPGERRLLRLDAPKAAEALPLAQWPGAKRGPEDLALISFSSGTTGRPKGVMLTHANIASNARAALASFSCGPGDVFLSVLPLHHMFESTGGLLCPFISGAKVHYLSSLNPRVLAESMQREGVTICLMVPALARLIHKRILGAALSAGGLRGLLFRVLFALSKAALRGGVRLGGVLFPRVRRGLSPRLRYFGSGGAALDPEVARDLLALGVEVIQGYGLTETSPVTHANRPGGENRIGTVGPPIPGVEARIEPVEGAAQGEGEILIRGPNVMKGYFDNPGLTAEVLRDGWFHTGDIGRIDRRGYLTICGRLKNVIVAASGRNIYPEEVEEELAKSDLFKEACVIGRKTRREGEEVFAVVVLNPEVDLPEGEGARREATEAELKRLCGGLADYKRVSAFLLWPGEALPRTTTLKHKREEIKAALRRMPGFGPEDF